MLKGHLGVSFWFGSVNRGSGEVSGACKMLVSIYKAPRGQIHLILWPGVLPPTVQASVSPRKAGAGDSASIMLGSQGLC